MCRLLGCVSGLTNHSEPAGRYGIPMTDTSSIETEYIVEHVDGPLAGTVDRRVLIDGMVDSRIGSVAAIKGLESLFWYVAGEQRTVRGETYVKYYFDSPDSDPVRTERDIESL